MLEWRARTARSESCVNTSYPYWTEKNVAPIKSTRPASQNRIDLLDHCAFIPSLHAMTEKATPTRQVPINARKVSRAQSEKHAYMCINEVVLTIRRGQRQAFLNHRFLSNQLVVL